MKYSRYQWLLSFWLIILMSTHYSLVCAEDSNAARELDRLFLTPQQRAMIDTARFLYEQKAHSNTPNIETSPSVTSTKKVQHIALNAMVLGKKNVLWINEIQVDKQMTLYGVMINPNRATHEGIWLKTPKGRRFLKLGQVYLLEQDKVVERYDVM